jgi:hypothetical protein
MKIGDHVRLLERLSPDLPPGTIGQITDIDQLPAHTGLAPLIRVRFANYQTPWIMSGLVRLLAVHE